jgi:hypothetical protein
MTLLMLGKSNATVYQYALTTAWDISTCTYSGKSKSCSADVGGAQAFSIVLKPDGKAMYVTAATATAYQYSL